MANCSPAELVAASKCFNGVPDNVKQSIIAYLLCQLSGGGVPGSGSGLTTPTDAQLVRGSMAVVSATFTRPNDTNAYSANDTVGPTVAAVMTFANVGRVVAGTGYITNVRLVKSTNVTSNATFRFWLYQTAPAAIADNAPFTLLYANRAIRLGYVDLPCTTEGAGSDSASCFLANVNLKFACAAGSRDLYGVLETKQAYAPGALENFWVEITADQN
jgi:hypothetical protein